MLPLLHNIYHNKPLSFSFPFKPPTLVHLLYVCSILIWSVSHTEQMAQPRVSVSSVASKSTFYCKECEWSEWLVKVTGNTGLFANFCIPNNAKHFPWKENLERRQSILVVTYVSSYRLVNVSWDETRLHLHVSSTKSRNISSQSVGFTMCFKATPLPPVLGLGFFHHGGQNLCQQHSMKSPGNSKVTERNAFTTFIIWI